MLLFLPRKTKFDTNWIKKISSTINQTKFYSVDVSDYQAREKEKVLNYIIVFDFECFRRA